MEGSKVSGNASRAIGGKKRESVDEVRVRRESLQAVLERCQRALESLKNADDEAGGSIGPNLSDEIDDDSSSVSSQCGSNGSDSDASELCDLLRSRVESPTFLEKLGSMHMSASQNVSDECSSWDLITKTDWDDELDQDGYVLVRQEDIVEGIACFMAAYLLSLKQTKELTPAQLQEALSKTFSVKKKKSKIRKAWDGSKVIYNVASWGATAIGIYQNPALFRAASAAFWTSCRVITKLL